MQQITILNHIERRYRINVTNRMIGLFLLYSLLIDCCCYARGPHHPGGGVNKRRAEQKHINEHLAFDAQHIQEDLNAQELPIEKRVEDMTEDERNYLYFKVHDLDGNGKLDGLEIFYSATHHHSISEHEHEHEHEHDENEHENGNELEIKDELAYMYKNVTDDEPETNGNEPNQVSNDISTDLPNLKFLEVDENGQIANKNINHIIDVLDNFLNLADLNNDGYLNYAEYAAAIKLGNTIQEDQHPEL